MCDIVLMDATVHALYNDNTLHAVINHTPQSYVYYIQRVKVCIMVWEGCSSYVRLYKEALFIVEIPTRTCFSSCCHVTPRALYCSWVHFQPEDGYWCLAVPY